MIAIENKKPNQTADCFGECAGDFRTEECRWWVGTPDSLHPSRSVPDGAKIINAPVVTCGGEAWIVRKPRPVVRRSSRAGYTDILGTGWAVSQFKAGWKRDAFRVVAACGRLFKPLLP